MVDPTNQGFREEFFTHQDSEDRGHNRTVRLLLQGAEAAMIQHDRIYHGQHTEFPGEAFRFSNNPDGDGRRRSSYFIGIFPLLGKIFLNGLLGIVLLLISMGEFGIFYKLAMPRLHSRKMLHFDYTGRALSNPASSISLPHATTISTATCTDCGNYQRSLEIAPVAAVDLFSSFGSWEYFHPDVVPLLDQESRVLTNGAPHYIEILLDLPESNLNREKIGMFSVLVDLHSEEDATVPEENDPTCTEGIPTTKALLLASSIRTVRIPHESFWISVVRKFLCLLPHMLGAIPESRRVVVPSFRFFVETEDFPLRYVTVRLIMSPEQAEKGDIVEVIGGSVHIGEELMGLPKFLKEWFFTCCAIGTFIFFVLQVLLFWLLQSMWEYQTQKQREQFFQDEVSEGLDLDGMDDAETDGRDLGAGSSSGIGEDRRTRSFDIEDEQGQWEDLPSPTTTNVVGSENQENPSGVPEPIEEETRHTIPEDDGGGSLPG